MTAWLDLEEEVIVDGLTAYKWSEWSSGITDRHCKGVISVLWNGPPPLHALTNTLTNVLALHSQMNPAATHGAER
jgi:hypothetical protein